MSGLPPGKTHAEALERAVITRDILWAAKIPEPKVIIVDFHNPLSVTPDPHWGTIVTGLFVISWVCVLVAVHWALS